MDLEHTTLPQSSISPREPLAPNTFLYKVSGDRSWQMTTEAATDRIETIAARYKVLEEIGSGGFGTTYLAIDTLDTETRHCVVKQLQPREASSEVSNGNGAETATVPQRCIEAELLHQLGQHPQIPTLLDAFEVEGATYIVQEFVPGRSLRQEWTEGQYLSQEETIALLEQLLEVVTFIHHRGAIHRDIKPSNILRSERDGRLFLIDYGAVKQLDGRWKQPNRAIGSRGYAAPEQMAARPRLNSDIYSLGIVAIEALTGIPGYQLHEGSVTGPVLLENFPIAPGLAAILRKMVDCNPYTRYQMATDVLADLKFLSRDSG